MEGGLTPATIVIPLSIEGMTESRMQRSGSHWDSQEHSQK
jgi:hypothetical protein